MTKLKLLAATAIVSLFMMSHAAMANEAPQGAPDGGPEGGVYMRTVSATGELSAPQLLVPTRTTRSSGFPRIVPLGGKKFLLTCTRDGESTQVLAFCVELD